jgi:hypothetical protein
MHDQDVGVRVVGDGLADARVEQAMDVPVVATDDDHLGAALLGELDDAVGRLADGTLILGITDPLRLEILARGRQRRGVLLGRVGRVDRATRPPDARHQRRHADDDEL